MFHLKDFIDQCCHDEFTGRILWILDHLNHSLAKFRENGSQRKDKVS